MDAIYGADLYTRSVFNPDARFGYYVGHTILLVGRLSVFKLVYLLNRTKSVLFARRIIGWGLPENPATGRPILKSPTYFVKG